MWAQCVVASCTVWPLPPQAERPSRQAPTGSCIRLRPQQPDNAPEFVAKAVQEWIAVVGAKTAYIEWGSPWRTATSRDSTLAFATSCSTAKWSILSAGPKSSSRTDASLGYKPPAPEVFVPAFAAPPKFSASGRCRTACGARAHSRRRLAGLNAPDGCRAARHGGQRLAALPTSPLPEELGPGQAGRRAP